MTLANTFAPTNCTTQTFPSWQAGIDSNAAAVAFAAAAWQPTVTGTDMVVHVASGTVPTSAGVTAVAAQTVTLATANATNPRIDLVVLDRVTGTIAAVTGTPAATPAAPAVPAGKLPCCQVTVRAATTTILGNDGTDTRALWLVGLRAAAFEALGGPVVDDGAGNLTVDAHLLTAATSVDLTNDAVLIYSAAAGAPRKAAPSLLGGVSAAAFLAVQQDLMQLQLQTAIANALAASAMVAADGMYDAFNSDTLSGVSGTTNPTYDVVNKLYASNSATVVSTTLNTSNMSTGSQNTCRIDETYTVGNSKTVMSIGCYQTVALNVELKIFLKNGSGNYTCAVSQTFAHAGGGWQDFTLTTPYSVPASGTYYIGVYPQSAPSIDNTSSSGAQYNGDVAQGATQSGFSEVSGSYILTRYTWGSVGNMTLVGPALSPAPASAPSKALLAVLWKDVSGSATLNTDFTAEVTENGGTNWVAATLVDSGVTIAGFKVLTATVALTSGGTTVQWRLKTLNNRSEQVKGVALMTQ